MRILLLAVGVMFSFNMAQAQYSALVETKMQHLTTLQNTVSQADDLSAIDKAWALKHIEKSKTMLLEASEQDLAALQVAETKINRTSKKVAGRLLMAKKAKLMSRITTLEAMIAQYQAEGLDTEPLERLQASMQLHLFNLGL